MFSFNTLQIENLWLATQNEWSLIVWLIKDIRSAHNKKEISRTVFYRPRKVYSAISFSYSLKEL